MGELAKRSQKRVEEKFEAHRIPGSKGVGQKEKGERRRGLHKETLLVMRRGVAEKKREVTRRKKGLGGSGVVPTEQE